MDIDAIKEKIIKFGEEDFKRVLWGHTCSGDLEVLSDLFGQNFAVVVVGDRAWGPCACDESAFVFSIGTRQFLVRGSYDSWSGTEIYDVTDFKEIRTVQKLVDVVEYV